MLWVRIQSDSELIGLVDPDPEYECSSGYELFGKKKTVPYSLGSLELPGI